MKILNSKKPSMDNKLKFSDRFKVLLNSDIPKGIDPYVFNDIEQPFVVSTGGKNIKLIAPKNSKIPNVNRNKSKGKCLKTKIKIEPTLNNTFKEAVETNIDDNAGKHVDQLHSYTLKQKQKYLKKLQRLKAKRQRRDHTLQYYPRAGDEVSDSDSSGDELHTYQHYWHSGDQDPLSTRATRLALLHSHLQRQLGQLQFEDNEAQTNLKRNTRILLGAAIRDPTTTGRILNGCSESTKIPDGPLIVGGLCGVEGCHQTSLPCTRHCSRHIMLNSDQLLFEHCTAKFSDNTQCCIPVFDVAHELPLCPEHARKRDNYHRRAQESKPKKARTKKLTSPPVSVTTNAIAVATISRSSKSKSRPKKRKRTPSTSKLEIKAAPVPVAPIVPVTIPMTTTLLSDENHFVNPILNDSDMHTKTLNNLNVSLNQGSSNVITHLNSLGLDIGSLELKEELDDHEVFASLDHATEHDFENVLNNLPADAFNDLFIETRNGEYEPSREEEEELERAVEAFDKDVRNLERLGQTHGLLEPALLAQLMSDIAS